MSKAINRLRAARGRGLAEELSIVPTGAQQRTFLLTKEKQVEDLTIDEIEEITKTVVEAAPDSEQETIEELAKELSASDVNKVRAALRLVDGLSGNAKKSALEKVRQALGEKKSAKKQEEEEEEDEKKKKRLKARHDDEEYDMPDKTKKKAIKKEDLSVDDLPKDVRGHVEALFKANEALETKAKEAAESFDKLQKEHREMVDEIRTREYIAKVQEDFGHIPGAAKDLGETLKKLADLDPKLAAKVQDTLTACNKAIESGEVFKSFGTNGSQMVNVTNAGQEIDVKAEELMKSDSKLTKSQAVDTVVQKNPALYNRHEAESRSRNH